jgi:hypothetical protein
LVIEGASRLFIKRLDLTFEFDQQGFAFSIQSFAGWYFNPALAQAIFFDIKALFVVESYADVMLKHRLNKMRADRVDGQMVGEWGALCSLSHVLIFHDLGFEIKLTKVMSKYLCLLLAMAMQPSAWGGWLYFTNNNHGSNDYYYSPVEDKGKVKVLRTFTQWPVDGKVPFHTPKAVVKVMLYNYSSEQSTYEINCQEQSIQLMERIFYRDMVGKVPLITHTVKDTFIQQSNSEFARQFIKTPLHFDDIKHYRMYEVACKP